MVSIKQKTNWSVYIIHCSDNSLYTGISTDVHRRFKEHTGPKGAKYFRGRKPEKLVYIERGHTRSTASQREITIKGLARLNKQKLIQSASNEIDEA